MIQQRYRELSLNLLCIGIGVLACANPEWMLVAFAKTCIGLGSAALALWISGEIVKVCGGWKLFVEALCHMGREKRARRRSE